jgi:hypothetical protein
MKVTTGESIIFDSKKAGWQGPQQLVVTSLRLHVFTYVSSLSDATSIRCIIHLVDVSSISAQHKKPQWVFLVAIVVSILSICIIWSSAKDNEDKLFITFTMLLLIGVIAAAIISSLEKGVITISSCGGEAMQILTSGRGEQEILKLLELISDAKILQCERGLDPSPNTSVERITDKLCVNPQPIQGHSHDKELEASARKCILDNETRILEQLDLKSDSVKVSGGVLANGSLFAGQVVSDFFIDRFAVSWGEFKRVRDWATKNGYDLGGVGEGSDDDCPVVNVCWFDALKWCNARSEMEGFAPFYLLGGKPYRTGTQVPNLSSPDLAGAGAYRLPSEAEWEWAARGGRESSEYSFSGGDVVGDVAWCKDDSLKSPMSSGRKLPNEIGIYDMSGNVWEWCFDAHQEAPKRVVRGGSFVNLAEKCKVSARSAGVPDQGRNSIGFRLAKSCQSRQSIMVWIFIIHVLSQ